MSSNTINIQPIPSQFITDDFSTWNYYFRNFDDKYDFNKKGKEAWDRNPDVRESWGTTREPGSAEGSRGGKYSRKQLDDAEFVDYEAQSSLDEAMDLFDDLFTTIDMGGALEKDRLKISDDKRGVFDFGLASQGLYRRQEYYNEELAKDSPFEFPTKPPGVVPWKDVYQDKMKQKWYTSESTKKKYLLELRQEGLTELLMKNPDTSLKIVSGMTTTLKPTKGLKFATSTKKAYIIFNKKGGKAEKVDLYIGQGGLAGLSASGMLARALPLMLAARYFEMAGVKTRINAVRAYITGTDMIMYTYMIKDYGQDLDWKWLAINVADRRWFRWNMWKYVGAMLKEQGSRRTSGWGSTTYAQDSSRWGPGMLEGGNRYKNWYKEQVDAGLQPDLQLSRNLMLFGGLENPGENIKDQVEDIKTEFFRILDIVDFQYNKPNKVAQRIQLRFEEQGKSITDFKIYTQKTIGQAYSYAEEGEYSATRERRETLNEEYDIALNGLNEYLITIQEPVITR